MCCQLGACETLIVWENLDLIRYVVKDPNEESDDVIVVTPAQNKTKEFLKAADGMDKEVLEYEPIVEWMVNNYKKVCLMRCFGGFVSFFFWEYVLPMPGAFVFYWC